MTDLYEYAPPFGVEVLRTQLLPLGGSVVARRRAGDPLPQRILTRIGGPTSDFTDEGVYSVHDLAEKGVDGQGYTDAETAAWVSWRRIMLLKPPLGGQTPVTLESGQVVFVDQVLCTEAPRWEFYSDTVERFVARYRVDLRFVAAP